MRRLALIVPLLLSACASAGQPSAPPDPSVAGPPVAFPSVYALIGEREELDLTSEQVTALDSIGGWISAENGSLLRELGPLGMTEGISGRPGRRRPPELTDEARASLERIRENNARAMRAVEETLTPEQRTRVCELDREKREARMRELRREPRGAPRRRLPPEMAPDGSTLRMQQGGWIWCGRAADSPADTKTRGGAVW